MTCDDDGRGCRNARYDDPHHGLRMCCVTMLTDVLVPVLVMDGDFNSK